jgi:hypothetical protein
LEAALIRGDAGEEMLALGTDWPTGAAEGRHAPPLQEPTATHLAALYLRLLVEEMQPSSGVAHDDVGRKPLNQSQQFSHFRFVGEYLRGVQERRAAGRVKVIGPHNIIACGRQTAGHVMHFRADAKPIHEENDVGQGPVAIGI